MQTSFRYILSLAVVLAAALTVAQASPVPVSTLARYCFVRPYRSY